MIYRQHWFRASAAVVLVALIAQILVPTVALALTQGPQQPEFSSFEPVTTTSLVNEFTGGFTYSLPVLSVPGPSGLGYALSLSYHSNVAPEEEASWVGFGWTLNPGAINRMKRGFPDERRGESVEFWNKTHPNITVTATKRIGLEAWSSEGKIKEQETGTGLSMYVTTRHNNFRGYGHTVGANFQFAGVANLGVSRTDGKSSFSFSINPAALLSSVLDPGDKGWSNVAMKAAQMAAVGTGGHYASLSSSTGRFGVWNVLDYAVPTVSPKYSGSTWTVGAAAEFAILPNTGVEIGISGTVSSQQATPLRRVPVYGYMYSGEAMADAGSLMDYSTELDGSYDSRDRFLAIPFSQPDLYLVTGEGLGGGFRLHQKRTGSFRPNRETSSDQFYSFNADVHFGVDFGYGGGFGGGEHSYTVEGAGDAGYSFEMDEDEDEPVFFRFTDDLGGNVTYSSSDGAESSMYNGDAFGPLSNAYLEVGQGRRVGRSAMIGYNTNAELLERILLGCEKRGVIERRAFTRSQRQSTTNDSNANLTLFVDRTDPSIAHGVGEFAITKEDGSTYLYGLPVYSRGEESFQLGVQGAVSVKDNFLVFHSVPKDSTGNSNNLRSGRVDALPYATTYLLTGIIGPDYVDRRNDGLTKDDLGGYVRFNYTRIAGSTRKSDSPVGWYKWRMPYRGLQYERNSLSSPYDDVGTVQYGHKELYYLKSIETKTHVAVFVTGGRNDGLPAVEVEATASADSTATTANAVGVPVLQKLNRIELWAKDTSGSAVRLITTTRFDYSYELSPGLPNARDGSGKLTLRKVWFEHDGAVSSTISPYVFGYEYLSSADYDSRLGTPMSNHPIYGPIVRYGDSVSVAAQNPPYSPFNVDRWGSYQYDGRSRHKIYNPWVDQTPGKVTAGVQEFDPAAWQLKTIRLPSGGEIHVQYEQHRYTHVQNRPAMVMAHLAVPNPHPNYDDVSARNKYYIDNLAIGIPNEARQALRDAIQARYIDVKELCYFRFMYVLETANPTRGLRDTLLDRCNVEHISGYAEISEVGLDPVKGVWVRFATKGNALWEVRPLPETICIDYARTHHSGDRILTGSCKAPPMSLPTRGELDLVTDLFFRVLDQFDEQAACRWLSYSNSYLRVPAVVPKLGGGVRVKRLLMVDPGLEAGESAIYGTEFRYERLDGSCSGVATNEPQLGGEENALVASLSKRDAQGTFGDFVAGEDREQFEGPLGRSLLPAPSIGYECVIASNLHVGVTGTGCVVSEFYTAKDYPNDLFHSQTAGVPWLGTAHTSVNGPGRVTWGADLALARGSYSNQWKSQGYRFVVTGMHGQPKRVTALAHPPSGGAIGSPVSTVEYSYFKPGEAVPLAMGPSISDTVHGHMGKEMELVTESRHVDDFTWDATGQIDVGASWSFLFPLPWGSFGVRGAFEWTEFRQHVTNKVVRYPVIMKATRVKKDGIETFSENLAFDPQSGKPVIVRTTDGHDSLMIADVPHGGSYYSVTIPATQHYPEMGQRARNYRATYSSGSGCRIHKRYGDGKHWLLVNAQVPLATQAVLSGLSRGDLVEITGDYGYSAGVYHIGNIAGNRVELVPVSFSRSEPIFQVSDVAVRVLHSGRTNQLTAPVGTLRTYRLAPNFTIVPRP